MTVALVHGVPESPAIWHQLVAELGRDDVVALAPPGFGAPVPDGFEATSDGYRDWLIAELEQLDGPVDVVGHDWGGGHAMRAATVRPDLVRRLVTDIAGTADRAYEWHDMARVWQTEGEGESVVAAMSEMPLTDRIDAFVAAGMSVDGARACAEAGGTTMGECVLRLYRSAVQPRMTLWGDQFVETRNRPPTLVIVAHDDHYTGGPDMTRRVAQRWGASVAELEGLGHWWMMQDPVQSATAIGGFLDR